MEIKLNHMQDKTKFFFFTKAAFYTYPFVWIREQVPKQAVDISYKVSRKDPIHRSLGIYWPKTIPNQDLFNMCQQEDMTTKIARRRVETGLVIYLKRLGQHYQKKRF